MVQKDKELFLKDLCARLPYGVICTDNIHGDGRISNIDINLSSGEVFVYFWDFDEYAKIENIKSYLRPMSSMTEDNIKELSKIDEKRLIFSSRHLTYRLDGEIVDYLNRKMFDYRGLIEKGLALEAPKDMYNIM